MNCALRFGFASVVLTAFAGAAQALTITPISGTNATPVGTLGANGYTYKLETFAGFSNVSKTASLTFSVTPDAGTVVTGFVLAPQGILKNGTYTIDLDNVLAYTHTATSPTYDLGTATATVAAGPAASYTLDFSAITGAGGVLNAKNFNLYVTTAPVPEPASMAALAIGGLGLVARRKRNR